MASMQEWMRRISEMRNRYWDVSNAGITVHGKFVLKGESFSLLKSVHSKGKARKWQFISPRDLRLWKLTVRKDFFFQVPFRSLWIGIFNKDNMQKRASRWKNPKQLNFQI